jgi:hypothetical protein
MAGLRAFDFVNALPIGSFDGAAYNQAEEPGCAPYESLP